MAVALAEAVNGVIISADSIQVYRGFDVGSGKPSPEELARAPHRLIDTNDPLDEMDAPTWAALAEQEIVRARSAGKVPIVCGGSFFWIRALVLGLAPAPPADPAIRARHRAIVLERGRQALHDALAAIDPASATRLHPNDVVRVSRALEVHELSGRTMTDWHAEHGFRGRHFETNMLALAHPPSVLTERIELRVDEWLAAGWIDEVRGLLDTGYGSARAMASVGYAEVRSYLAGDLAREDLRTAIVRATRVYARRQRTWLNHAEVTWLT
jgi:tRNA dimethylallyltransferase